VNAQVSALRAELARLDSRRAELLEQIRALAIGSSQKILPVQSSATDMGWPGPLDHSSPQEAKIRLFRGLFHGRDDVFPRRFESAATGKSGYQPVCRNEWRPGRCAKPKVKCVDCAYREFVPVTDDTIRNHLSGYDPTDSRRTNFVIGV